MPIEPMGQHAVENSDKGPGTGIAVILRFTQNGDVMKSRTSVHQFSILLGGCLAALALSGGALAQSHGGGGHSSATAGGGGHGGFSGGYGSHGGTAGYGYRGGTAGYGYRGGTAGYGYRGGTAGYGYRGGYYGGYPGYRGGYYGGYRGGYYGWGGGWGWGWGGVGLGMYFATLPLYYSTYYWGGVPYYYANDVYYNWDPNVNQYVTVSPPAGLQAQDGQAPAGQAPAGGSPASSTELMAYPKNGQTAEQQAKDKFECHQWAVGQSGFDPAAAAAGAANQRNDYMRAQAACLEGRGYSVQ
jgi:hypothetical protein